MDERPAALTSPSPQGARWSLVNLARLLGRHGEWTRDPSGPGWGFHSASSGIHPFTHRGDLLLLSRAGTDGSTMYLAVRTVS